MNSNLTPPSLPTITLKEAILRLSVSPIKADREAISRLERETGRDVQKIIADLDSADITLKALEEKSPQLYGKLWQCVAWGFFLGSLIGIVALFVLAPQRLPIAIALGFILGISLPIIRR